MAIKSNHSHKYTSINHMTSVKPQIFTLILYYCSVALSHIIHTCIHKTTHVDIHNQLYDFCLTIHCYNVDVLLFYLIAWTHAIHKTKRTLKDTYLFRNVVFYINVPMYSLYYDRHLLNIIQWLQLCDASLYLGLTKYG